MIGIGQSAPPEGLYRPAMADWLSVILSTLALGIAAGALVVARRNANAADTSAVEAGRSADAANRSADAAEDSAHHAESSAASAAVVARIEASREHESCRPQWVGPEFTTEENARTQVEHLFFEFSLNRTYRMAGYATHQDSKGRTPLPVDLLVLAGVPQKVAVQDLRPARDYPSVTFLHFQFWPPADVDDVEHWRCDCGRPVESGGEPHWEVTVPVKAPDNRIVGPIFFSTDRINDWDDDV
jgi:hypothetical protein